MKAIDKVPKELLKPTRKCNYCSRVSVYPRRSNFRSFQSISVCARALLNDYYSTRGWSEEGIPPKNKLKELDLELTINYQT